MQFLGARQTGADFGGPRGEKNGVLEHSAIKDMVDAVYNKKLPMAYKAAFNMNWMHWKLKPSAGT